MKATTGEYPEADDQRRQQRSRLEQKAIAQTQEGKRGKALKKSAAIKKKNFPIKKRSDEDKRAKSRKKA